MTQVFHMSESARPIALSTDDLHIGNRYVLSLAALHRDASVGLLGIEAAAAAWAGLHGRPQSGPDTTPMASWAFDSPPATILSRCRFLLREGVHVFGRSADCGLRLDCPGISRRHVRIHVLPTRGVLVCDLGSTNGTRVDGELIVEVAVEGPAVLDIGPLRLLLRPDRAP